MQARLLRVVPLVVPIALLAACEQSKSANPLSPSVAGPIPGVEITAAKPLVPQNNSQVPDDAQPLTLVVENAGTNGERPLSLAIEIAADPQFQTRVFAREGLSPGPSGQTAVRLPDRLASDRTYFWRARALDGANTGPWSEPVKFTIVTPIVIKAPTPRSPVGGETVGSNGPTFRVGNAARSGPVGGITYIVQVASNESFSSVVGTFTGAEQGGASGETAVGSANLPWSTTLFWRARGTDGKVNGDWSGAQAFRTPAEASTPAPGPSPAPPPSPGGGGSCASRDRHAILRCIEAKYPDRRRAGVSLDQRKANMAFLRDRIIEAGLCGGLDLGWNLKRGGPELSIDFIVDRRNGQNIGVDIAGDYDNTGKTLSLHWLEDGPGSHYKAFPNPQCN
jgi:hypothetical protein